MMYAAIKLSQGILDPCTLFNAAHNFQDLKLQIQSAFQPINDFVIPAPNMLSRLLHRQIDRVHPPSIILIRGYLKFLSRPQQLAYADAKLLRRCENLREQGR
jgi:hypothetical protein